MKTNKYKILVLSDLKESTNNTLKKAISLSKIINADIAFFHAKKATDIVERESQLSAMRTINKEHLIIENKINNIIEPISINYGIKLKSSFAFGNVKSEISDYIKSYKPDVIVLGKRKSKPLRFISDNITDYVLNIHKGEVMIVSKEDDLEPDEQLALGFFNTNDALFNLKYIDDLLEQTQQPLRLFNIGEVSNTTEKEVSKTDYKVMDYVFEKNDNIFNTLSNYLLKSNVNLLCINRRKNKTITKSEIKNMIHKTQTSILLTNEI